MSKKGTATGVVIAIVVIAAIALYTNIFELAKPAIETSLNSTKDAVSKVQGKDVVSKAEQITSDIKSIASQVKVQNPLESKK